MKTINFITLPDRRKLADAEFGKPYGHPSQEETIGN